ncbi:MAG TPA: DUF1501 domain-containing protein [Steroidobacteraceae bacterium]|jgi:uncharacterized protein (DUF1501 family)|nr:DUF1501 domain-containing protein [Steroidobacteraceae bacterium]
MHLTRRSFLESSLFAGASTLVASRLAFADAPTDARFVFVLLRGALDGLSAVPPVGDPAYAGLRGQIALSTSGADAARPLDHTFALHPAFEFLHQCYAAKELLVLHAIASPYRERSHFDGQNVLESGGLRPHDTDSGWLNRALSVLPASHVRESAVALGANVPLAMRGPVEVASWSPTKTTALDDETLARITDLYARDPLLSRRLAEALESDAIANEAQGAANADADEATMAPANVVARDDKVRRAAPGRYTETAKAAAGFLRRDDGPRVAMFDTTGWDTHANEGGGQGQLAGRLKALDGAMAALKETLGPAWRHTAVLIATEFGRTAAINGTRGTDHGTGAAAFLLGGAVAGGRVLADWPGLSHASLYEGRDLRPTRDLRSIMKGVLHDHLQVANAALDSEVFPGSGAARAMGGLIRAV